MRPSFPSSSITMSSVPILFAALFAQPAVADVFISEYIEGSSNNKAIEIYNGNAGSVDLAAEGYALELYFNGGTTPSTTINLTGTLAAGATHVVAHSSSAAAVLAVAQQTTSSMTFNGDDAVVLKRGSTVLDSIGQVGVDPGSAWGTAPTTTLDATLRRKDSVTSGDTVIDDAFDPASQWDGYAKDSFDGLGSHTATGGADVPPTVTSTVPTQGASNVAEEATLGVNFSEPVTTGANAFSLSCNAQPVTLNASGGPQSYTLTPTSALPLNASCTLTVTASEVSDQDGTSDLMAANHVTNFTVTGTSSACGAPATLISAIQGNGTDSPLANQTVTLEAVVVADFQATNELKGFFLQEEDADQDADPLSSEGLFIYDNNFGVAVNVGDVVRLTGKVNEYYGQTQISNLTLAKVCSTGVSVTPATPSLPMTSATAFEPFEGMLVTLPQVLTVTENYNLGRYGETLLSSGGRLLTPTNVVTPGAAAQAMQAANDLNKLVLDDGRTIQNPDPLGYPGFSLSASNSLRTGSTISNLTGVLGYGYDAWRVHPTADLVVGDANPRPQPNDLPAGRLKLASFNVLNYFNGDGAGGGFPTARGANTAAEFTRQRDKIIAAMTGLGADVYGLMEIENDGYGSESAIADLTAGLNSASGRSYSFINPGLARIGTDEIAVGLIYDGSKVTPLGNAAILDSSVNPQFDDTKNRPSLAQSFREIATGEVFTVVVNHLKSKGSACDAQGDPDTGDGQGNCNLTRTRAAQALTQWLATDPTGSGDTDILLIGDMNSYAKEDPISTFLGAGYTNLIEQHKPAGAAAYSYVFGGQSGYLDHALATASLATQVSGAAEWHINADEAPVLDYNVEYKSTNQQSLFYAPTAYRSSDHDPVVIALELGSTPAVVDGQCGPAHASPRAFAPSGSALCTAGTASVVASSNGKFTWTCSAAAQGGQAASCEAPWSSIPGDSGQPISGAIHTEGAGCSVTQAVFSTSPSAPNGMILPYGLVDFVLENCTPHETATVTLSYSAPLPAGTQYYKLKEGAWIHIPEAIINGNTIQFPIQDNGPLDLDPTEGVIHDPSGPTLTAGAVPLLGPLGLLLTPVLLGGLAAFGQVRRRQREAQAQAHSLQ